MKKLDPLSAHRIWAATYDSGPNPLLALETRILSAQLGNVAGRRILDAACGTGRWMAWAHARGASVTGFDLCPEMLAQAAQKPGLAGRLTLANLTALPARDDSADTALCSLALSYVSDPGKAIREIRRTAPLVYTTDLHPAALKSGWTRTFRSGGNLYEVESHDYDPDLPAANGLSRAWRTEAFFDEPELPVFQAAGKAAQFETMRLVPALLITAWARY